MADTADNVLIFSADGHAGAKRMRDYLPYFDPEIRDTVADLLTQEEQDYRKMMAPDFTSRAEEKEPDPAERLWSPAAPERFGGWDIDVRMQQLDSEGVAGEILVPGHQFSSLPLFSVVNKPFEADLRDAGMRAYHRWLADFMAGGDGRLYGMADPGPCHDIDAAVRELTWAREHGFVSVGAPGIIEDPTLPSLFSDHYEPFWQACVDTDTTLMVHAGWGFPQGRYQEFISAFLATHLDGQEASQMMAAQQRLDDDAREALQKEFAESPASPFRLDFGPRRLLWQLMLAGVFDRYPSLRFVLTEVRSDWVPMTLQLLDSWFEERETPLTMRPSEYWARNCFATPSSIHKVEVEARDAIGAERLMLGIDYPHPEGMWPDTWNWIRVAFDGVPENEARMILGENAMRAFPVDAQRLQAVADRIGPSPRDLLSGSENVPADHVEHYHRRGGFLRATERVDTEAVLSLADEDLRLVH
ncbi:amidohydrolase family protein [Mycolicibacterium flavescens]|uniref:Amidohydrolase n=1 Tax=Mycolicibacterium flavescens TaxID=1776 RepID=A0A1E3RHD4_MYCFV|nr:amidohydrolase family protein [Mycolicibacterium flavescens]MCV7280188.1 amidohydrolase family protein [Mycolicibacterium flavescens]ODQ89286.1 amidohydrolase [Mycolicibacterium flavescens]